ncbi:ABC transporter substrate-binding protein [Sporichthya polymorpha]|uniref:ABC transporter substrate-binding protein n=1 Tax=Sporichthya polymorpha TaxID=35751 RepID=UPI0003A63EA4|nr:ABC transporter substrate-binding protein [Sporichthya polymorpha]
MTASEFSRRALRAAAVVASAALVLSACGARTDHAAVVAAESGGLAEQLAQTQASAAAAAPATADAGTGAVAAAPGAVAAVGGTVPAGGAGAAPTPAAGTKSSAGRTNASGGAKTPVAAGCAKQGPPVVLGQVGAFSGLVGANNQGAVQTLPVWVRDVNARGGLGCHPVTLFQKDTASDPAKAEAAVKEMVQVRNAVALIASYAPLDIVGFRKGVESAKIVSVGGDQVTPDWHLSPYLYPVGGIEKAQFAGSAKALQSKGVDKLAIFYCVESSACTAFKDTLDRDGYAKKFGMSIVYQTQISLTQNDFTSACQAAKNAGAKAVVFAGDAGGVQRTARSCATVGLDVPIVITASQATFDPNDKNLQKATVSMATPIFPFISTDDNQAIKDYRAAMARYNPTAEFNNASALTWSSAKMLERAVELLGPSARDVPLTRDLILQGLGKVKKETLGGLIPATTYTLNQPHAQENFCFAAMGFDSRGFFAPAGARFDCI